MKSQILIDNEPYICTVALLEDGVLNEFYAEHKGSHRLTGNIYKGRVVNTMPGLSSAFVDIGLRRNGFLNAQDMLEDRSVLAASGAIPTELDVHEGDYILVQATKEEVGQKGARLTANISLPGRYVVYLPTLDFIGVSNRITDPEEREKITELIKKNKPESGGIIARTVCRDAKKSFIIEEIKTLQALYKTITERAERIQDIALLHSDGGLLFRSVRDMLMENGCEIYCNTADVARSLRNDLALTAPRFVDKVHAYEGSDDMFMHYHVLSEVDKILKRKVELKNGASIVIDYTEALTAIDVNSGRYSPNLDREETVFNINMEAAREIMRQIRLRNVGGIIAIDFIDMQDPEHCAAVVNELRKESVKDRTRTRIMDMTDPGIVLMTRKKTGSEISTLLLKTCETCKGFAHTQSAVYMAFKIKAYLNSFFATEQAANAIVTVCHDIYEELSKSSLFYETCRTDWRGKRVYLVSGDVAPDVVKVTTSRDSVMSLPNNAVLLG